MRFATILMVLAILLYLAIAVVLIRKYLRTRDAGLLWLGIAVVIWPAVSSLLGPGSRALFDRLGRHESVALYPFSLVASGQMTQGELVMDLQLFGQLVRISLFFVAVLYLLRSKSNFQTQN